jgi:hypothetical protein
MRTHAATYTMFTLPNRGTLRALLLGTLLFGCGLSVLFGG